MITYILALIVLIVVLGTHLLGLTGLYITIFWYDIMMHILGGVGIALFLLAWVQLHGQGIVNKRRFIIIGTIVAGLIWELFEMYYELNGYPLWSKMYYLDTIKDLIDDTLGAVVVAYIGFRNK